MRCLECGAEMRLTSEPMTEEFKGGTYTVCGIERYVCDACGNDQMSIGNAEKLSRRLAEKHAHAQGLLSPGEIKATRKSMGLTQKEFEKLVGVSSPTASRWESGAVQQSKTADILIRLLSEHPDAREDAMERAEIHAGSAVAVPTWSHGVARPYATGECRAPINVGETAAPRTALGSAAVSY